MTPIVDERWEPGMGLEAAHPRLEEPGVPSVPLFRNGRAPGRLAPVIPT